MTVERIAFLGNPNIGVYALSTETYALVPPGLPRRVKGEVERTLGVRVAEATVLQTTLLGILIVGNTNGMLVPHLTSDREIEVIQSSLGVKVTRLETNLTALGNIILANDHGAVVHPRLRESTLKSIESILGVKAVPGRVAGSGLVGSSAVATNRGALVSSRATEDELDWLADALGVPTSIGTVNRGVVYIRSGLAANSKGGLAGQETTGPELDRIEDALELI